MYNANEEELSILKYWQEHKCFEKSVAGRPENRPYVFYDGPPFATGLPHYGHILSSVIKDVVPRYWTMKGYHVRRRWGWDCHGMPIENIVEKELKISGKKDIEKIGVDKFNETCRSKVLTYAQEWKKMVDRVGRWIEFDNSYKTMDPTYMESVWWAIKTIWDKGLIYEGRRVLMYCPRCETPVSKAEVAMDNSYKDITEESVTIKFKVKDPARHKLPDNTYILAWTTTPWTLPGNVALAVGKNIDYVLVKEGGEHLILASERVGAVMKNRAYEEINELKGSKLVGLEYEPLYEIHKVKGSGKPAWYVAPADFVTTLDGTGVVHTAVIYGEDDFELGAKIGLPMVPLLDSRGVFNEDAPDLIRGVYFKDAEKRIKEDLMKRGLLFDRENFLHPYPHCWRCETQLYYNAISAWFINIQKIKKKLVKLNEKINWYPDHLKHGRFLNILETAPDWNISRNRYWATPLPFWRCENKGCDHLECLGSVKELREKAVNFSEVYETGEIEEMDLHKDKMDRIRLKCSKCGGLMQRTPEVIDCWVESAAMPFAEFHYPFENKAVFKKRFPGQYIAEYIAQTRAWFYYMHALSVLLFNDVSFENCVTTGNILNEKGEKLSKSKRNFTDPWIIIEQYGVDALRYYLMSSAVMEADDIFFSDREVKEVYNKVINILWNVVTFYGMYSADYKGKAKAGDSKNLLDRWILAKLQLLVKDATERMDNYDTVRASRPIREFIDDLSTWYLRRSRERFKGEDEADRQMALATLREVLLILSKVMAPFMPFLADKIYLTLGGGDESVHLADWPAVNKDWLDGNILEQMTLAKRIVELGLALRAEKGLRVRQPLLKLVVVGHDLSEEMKKIVAEELNVKQVETGEKKMPEGLAVKEDGEIKTGLDTVITEELKKEGLLRELVRTINQTRKEKGLTPADSVTVFWSSSSAEVAAVFKDYATALKAAVRAGDLKQAEKENMQETEVDGNKLKLYLE